MNDGDDRFGVAVAISLPEPRAGRSTDGAADPAASIVSTAAAGYDGRRLPSAAVQWLFAFAGIADATWAATEIQNRISARNAGLPADQRIPFRIGVNYGALRADRGRADGDALDGAVRLCVQADANAIVVSAVGPDRITAIIEDPATRPPPNHRRELILSAVGLTGLLAYFFGWYGLISWKVISFANTSGWPCWPTWMCN